MAAVVYSVRVMDRLALSEMHRYIGFSNAKLGFVAAPASPFDKLLIRHNDENVI